MRVELRNLGQIDYIGAVTTDDVVTAAEYLFNLRDAATQGYLNGIALLTIIYFDVVSVRFGINQIRRTEVERLSGASLDVDRVVVLFQDRTTAGGDFQLRVGRFVEIALTFLQDAVQVHGIFQLTFVVLAAVVVAPVEAHDERTAADYGEDLEQVAPRKVVIDGLCVAPLMQGQRNADGEQRDVDELEVAVAAQHVPLSSVQAVRHLEYITHCPLADAAYQSDQNAHAKQQGPTSCTHLTQAKGLKENEENGAY